MIRRSVALAVAFLPLTLPAQERTLPTQVRQYVSVDAPVVALTHARVIDGSGNRAMEDQTIIIRGEKIASIGASRSTPVPGGAREIDLTGKTVIPGIVGLHDHMYYGGMKFMGISYPRLFLSAGVTTIRTTGSVDPYYELNIKRQTDSLLIAGPTVVVTGPYLQGFGYGNTMHPLAGPDEARRLVRYWAEEGVTWFKAYTTVSRDILGAAIDEAHKHGVKVTAHLCSVGFREAVSLGIDALEHGFFTNTEWYAGKQLDKCPTAGDSAVFSGVEVRNADVQQTIREMVAHRTAMTSTLAVEELSSPSRVPNDQRVLDALHPDWAKSVVAYYERGRTAKDSVGRAMLRKSMEFEREFVRQGGLLGAGADPCCLSAVAGYADQRNFELLVEAGFTAEEAVKIMTANGAKILGMENLLGSIKPGLQADLIVLAGNPVANAADIKNVETVFRKGLGFDAARLKESIKGLVGFR